MMGNQGKRASLAAGVAAVVAASTLTWGGAAYAQAVPGGTLDPLSIPKYVTPLVIPPVMDDTGTDNDYDIAVRQFQQQILPGGHWNELAPKCKASPGLCELPATTVWSYGPANDPLPDSSGIPGGAAGLAPAPNSQFNYPAYTVENTTHTPTTVDWINDLVVDPWTNTDRSFLSHLLPIDRTLHWANPELLPCDPVANAELGAGLPTDCRPHVPSLDADQLALLAEPYDGPVPVIVHVHGAHVAPESDGYPEAWYLPDADNIPTGYATQGRLVNQYGTETNSATRPGVASFSYPNTQPSTTLWYHDHTLGMTRNNVYAGPAGFWLIRNADGGEDGVDPLATVLPAPAPIAGEGLVETNVTGRHKYREIPIVIQDRAFNADGSLFYPANRAFFEGLGDGQTPDNVGAGLDIPFFGEGDSDIAPIWNPEAFFNVMVVNGVSWPELEVAPAIYRFRLLNGSNSRFLNLELRLANKKGRLTGKQVPFYQIGAEQSVLPQVVRIEKGFATPLPGDGSRTNRALNIDACNGTPLCVDEQKAPFVDQANLMGLAERADVLVDFRGMKDGQIVRMINTAPDAPFGGFPDVPADPGTTGQVMQFRVNSALMGLGNTDPLLADGTPNPNAATAPWDVVLTLPEQGAPALNLTANYTKQDLALLEEESEHVCVTMDMAGNIVVDPTSTPTIPVDGTCKVIETGALAGSVPFAPKAAVLGTNGSGGGNVQLWSDPLRQNPELGATETWEMWNWSADAHPIHLHLVKFKVVNREAFDPATGALLGPVPASAHETGWKDTVIAYPGEVTRVNATFDLPGLYVWHCHIVEHEDNEMMVPFCVGDTGANGCQAVP
jgi:FtsP/CotA-like multicopper oxidase with cupredoxin domain